MSTDKTFVGYRSLEDLRQAFTQVVNLILEGHQGAPPIKVEFKLQSAEKALTQITNDLTWILQRLPDSKPPTPPTAA